MTEENESKLMIIVKKCNAYCIKKKSYLTLSDFYSHQCWREKEEERLVEGAAKAIGYFPSAEERRALVGYCKFFEERK